MVRTTLAGCRLVGQMGKKLSLTWKIYIFVEVTAETISPCRSRMPEQPNICMFREPHCEPDTRQQQAEKWRINSPQPITMHYTSVPVSSPIVIYSCPVIRACLRKKSRFVYPDVSFSLRLEYIPSGITLHVAYGVQGTQSCFQQWWIDLPLFF